MQIYNFNLLFQKAFITAKIWTDMLIFDVKLQDHKNIAYYKARLDAVAMVVSKYGKP